LSVAFFWYIDQVFVCFSELLYPEGSISPNSGIAADILCKGRDYLVSPTLLYLQNNKKILIKCTPLYFFVTTLELLNPNKKQ